MTTLLELNNIVKGSITKRPSKNCKTPYVADVILENTDEEILGHTPSLGCCGLANANANVYMTPINSKKPTKCKYTIQLSEVIENNNKQIIGINPRLAEELTESALKNNCFTKLDGFKEYSREKTLLNSRFDFVGIDKNGKKFVMEVKNVPLADYEDCLAKEKKKMDFSDRPYNSKISYFPDGYRKKLTDTVSPRALKHITELQELVNNHNMRGIMCYVIQRTDIKQFQPSKIDKIYREAVKNAVKDGVEIITLVVEWNSDGEAKFVTDNIFVNLDD